MRRLPVLSGVFVAGALAVAACSGGTPAASSVPTVPPTVPPTSIPSIALPTLPTGSFVIPSFVSDTDLDSRFPTTVNGKPVTHSPSASFLLFVQSLGGPDAQANIQAYVTLLQNNGINPATVTFGIGSVALGHAENFAAYHTPGVAAATLLSLYPQLEAITGGRRRRRPLPRPMSVART
jgi:hypothetical protein